MKKYLGKLFRCLLPAVLLAIMLVGALPIMPALALTGSTVATTTSNLGGGMEPYQRKNFYANERFWAFYSNGTDAACKSSTDGSTWGDAQAVKSGITRSTRFSVHFDGTYFHFVTAQEAVNQPLTYRRGTPNADGTITWSADEQIVLAANEALEYRKPTVTTDSAGYPWLALDYCSGATIYAYVLESSSNNGTWSTAAGSPYDLLHDAGCKASSLIPVASDEFYAFYVDINKYLYCKEWDGDSWGSQEAVSSNPLVSEVYYSAILNGDSLDVIWVQAGTPKLLNFRERSAEGTWGDIVTVQSLTTTIDPTLSLINNDGDLVTFFCNETTADHVCYKYRINGVWDESPTDWLNEASDHICYSGRIASTVISNFTGTEYIVGLQYMTKTSSPYNIKFALLTKHAPVLDAIGDKSVDENVLLTFTANATDADEDELAYSLSNNPEGSSINGTTGVFTWTPTYSQSGVYTDIQVSVSDGLLSDSENITITVIDYVVPVPWSRIDIFIGLEITLSIFPALVFLTGLIYFGGGAFRNTYRSRGRYLTTTDGLIDIAFAALSIVMFIYLLGTILDLTAALMV